MDRILSIQALQQSRTQVAVDEAQSQQAQSQLRGALSAIDQTRPETQPQVLQAEASLRTAYVARQRTKIVAPVTGYIAQRSTQVGQLVQPGNQLLTIVPLDQMWIDANFKESQLEKVRIGQPVVMQADLYGSHVKFQGKVFGIGMGTGNAFSVLPAQNATGNWIKIVQRVPVRIALDPEQLRRQPLRLGLSMNVSVSLRDTSGPTLSTTTVSHPTYQTDVYADAMRGANALIDKIVAENLGHDAALDNTSLSAAHSSKAHRT